MDTIFLFFVILPMFICGIILNIVVRFTEKNKNKNK